MGFVRKAIAAGGIGMAVVAIAGCGSDGRLLSSSESQQLQAQLDSVAQAVRDGDCTRARSALSAFQTDLSQLSGVNATLVNNLSQGASTIQALTTTKCSGWTGTTTTKHTRKRRPSETTTAGTTSQTQTTESITTPTQPSITSTTGGAGLGNGTTTGQDTVTPPESTTTPSSSTPSSSTPSSSTPSSSTPSTSTPSTTAPPTTTPDSGAATNTTGGAGYGAGGGA